MLRWLHDIYYSKLTEVLLGGYDVLERVQLQSKH